MIPNIIELAYNLAILVALSLISGFIRQPKGVGAVLQGLLFGGAAVIGMMRPLVLGPGLIFDGRSVMISLCSLFFGPLAASVSGAMAALYRIHLGGAGVYMGVLVIASSALLGLAFRPRWARRGESITAGRLLGFGLLVHLSMLLLMFTLPEGAGPGVIKRLGLPILLAYPLVTLLIGKVLSSQETALRSLEALRQSRAMLSQVLDTVPQSVFWKDREGRYLGCNRVFALAAGLDDPALIVGKTDFDLPWTREEAEAYRLDDQEVIERNCPKTHICEPLQQADGTRLWIDTSKTPLRDEGGSPMGVLGVYEDITERKQADEALRQEQLFSRSLLDSLPGIFYLYTYPELRMVLWNKQHESLLGYGAGELENRHLTDWHVPEAKAAVLSAVEAVMEQGQSSTEAPLLAKDGRRVPFILTGVKFEAQGRRFLMGIGIDITARKRAEAALQHSEQKFRTLFENLAEGVALHELVTDGTGSVVDYRLLDVNPAYQAHTGLEAASAAGRLGSQIYGTDPPPYLPEFSKVALGGNPYAFETYFQPLDKHFHISVISPTPGQFATVFEDITARRRREEELKQKNAEMERFTYMISHDLKSPLVTVRTFLGYLEQDLEKGKTERIVKDMGFIRDAAGKMARLLEDLLEVSRVGRVVNPSARIPLADLVQEALKAVAGAISTRGVAVQAETPPVTLFGDRPRLEALWQNLVENAVKYMGDQPSPRIVLGVEGRGPEAVFFVRDNGIGIDPRFHAKVFGLFEKLDPGSEGTGLGLALVKRIVELYEGRIWLESEGMGQGTCFRFTLPMAMKTRKQGAAP